MIFYCDLDGVLADFNKGVAQELGRPTSEIVGPDGRLDKTKYRPIILDNENFWKNLPPMPGADKLWSFLEQFDTYVLSAYANWDAMNSKKGKLLWCDRFGIRRNRVKLVLRSEKKHYAVSPGGPNVLIDDFAKNINEWREAGGIGILHTGAVSTIAKIRSLGLGKHK